MNISKSLLADNIKRFVAAGVTVKEAEQVFSRIKGISLINRGETMTHTITLDQPVKPGDNLALIIPTPLAIPAGATLLFSVNDGPVKLMVEADAPISGLRLKIKPYDGVVEIPARSVALVSPPGSVVPDGDWLKGIKWQSKDSINQLESELAKTLELAQQEIKPVVDNFRATAEKVSREMKDILDRHGKS